MLSQPLSDPILSHRAEDGRDVPLLVWRATEPVLAISSGVLGGGIGPCRWVVNASVPMSYDRPDPAVHLAEIAAGRGLHGPGVGLLTGVDVADVVAEQDDGVRLWATVGLGAPIQAAGNNGRPDAGRPDAGRPDAGRPDAGRPDAGRPDAGRPDAGRPDAGRPDPGRPRSDEPRPEATPRPGTVNIVVWVPQRLRPGALVNAVATVTEAKTQALRDLGLAATGTATDAVCVLCPDTGDPADYGGPRSRWGEPLARAAYRAVLGGGAVNLAGAQSWSDRQGSSHPADLLQ